MPTVVETHSQLARAKVGAFAHRLLPTSAGPEPVTLEVKSGVHMGSVLDLETGSFSIGPTSETDVMLLDDEALGGDALFETTPSLFGPLVTVTTEREDLRLNGLQAPANAASQPHQLPCTVDFNGISFVLCSARQARPTFGQCAERAVFPLLLTLATATFGAQIYLANQPQPALAFDPRPVQPAVAVTERSDSSETRVRDLITQAGLQDRLDVTRTGTDMLRISGDLPPDMLPMWRDIRGQVDTAAGGVAISSDVKAAPGISQMPQIAAVELGGHPKVHLADGTVLQSGDQISGDWVIRGIEVNAIQVERGSDTLTVSF